MQEVLTEENKKCEEKSLASYMVQDYESALFYTLRWKRLTEERYGYERFHYYLSSLP